MACPLFDALLWWQFGSFFKEAVDVMPPFKADQCILAQGDTCSLGEPFDMLVNCLAAVQLCSLEPSGDALTRQLINVRLVLQCNQFSLLLSLFRVSLSP